MSFNYRSAVSAALLLVTCSWAAPPAGAAEDTPLVFQFSETLRVHNQQTVVDKTNGSLTESVSREAGTLRLDAAMPIDGDMALDPSTPIVVTAGNLTLRSVLAADPHYRVGMHQANILLTTPSESGKSSVVYGHVKIRWTRNRLTVQVEGNLPALTPICARDFVSNPSKVTTTQAQLVSRGGQGESPVPGTRVTIFVVGNKGETTAKLEVGQTRATARVLFDIKSSARTLNGGPYEDSGIKWKYLNASPGEMDAGRHTAHDTTVKVTGSGA